MPCRSPLHCSSAGARYGLVKVGGSLCSILEREGEQENFPTNHRTSSNFFSFDRKRPCRLKLQGQCKHTRTPFSHHLQPLPSAIFLNSLSEALPEERKGCRGQHEVKEVQTMTSNGTCSSSDSAMTQNSLDGVVAISFCKKTRRLFLDINSKAGRVP